MPAHDATIAPLRLRTRLAGFQVARFSAPPVNLMGDRIWSFRR